MRTPQRPVWSEGMFLSPQHLQALDRYHEALLGARVAALSPQTWGVTALEIDGAALASGQLRVLRFSGIFPDGLVLDFSESDPEAPPSRAVADLFPPQARALDVWLAVPREREGVAAYAEEGPAEPAGAHSRFTVASRPVQDATQPGSSATVAFARPGAALLVGAESREDHEAIKIAELIRTPAGQLALAEGFIPPVLRIGASSWLGGAVRGLLARMHAKQRDLSGGRHQRNASGGELSGSEVARLLQIYALNGAIPVVAHLAESGDAPPLAAYLTLAQLAGQLGSFTSEGEPASLPRFSHTDLRGTFAPLLERLGAYLGGMALEQFVRIPLEVKGAMQVARQLEEKTLGAQLVLAVRTELPEAQVAEQLPRLCKIGSLSDLPALVQAAAPGLPLQVMHRPPPELPAKAGVIYFALAPPPGDRLWKNVLAERALALHVPPPFDPGRAKIELLALGGGSAPRPGA